MSERYDEEYVRREQGNYPDAYSDPNRAPYPGPPYNSPGYAGRPGYPGGPGYEERRTYSQVSVPPYNVRLVRTIWFIVGLLDALLVIRFVLRLLGASTTAAFVSFIYGLTDPLIAPFRGIFNTTGSGSYIFEPESLVAIVVYSLVGWGLVTFVRIVTAPKGPPPHP